MRTRWSAVAALGLVPVLAACAQPLSCTAIGCVSQVSVDVSSAVARAGPEPLTATLCVEGRCASTPVTADGSGAPTLVTVQLPAATGSPSDPHVGVTLNVAGNGLVPVRASTTATLVRFAPNGEACGPVCWSAALVLAGDRLVQAPTPSPSSTS